MIDRKKKLIFIQLTLLALGILVIYLTYYSKDENIQNKIISESTMGKDTEVDPMIEPLT